MRLSRYTRQRLQEISELQEDWDSYGGKPISSDVLKRVEVFLVAVCDVLIEPAVCPSPDGGVELSWQEKRKDVLVNFSPDGKSRLTIVNDEEVMIEEKEFDESKDKGWFLYEVAKVI